MSILEVSKILMYEFCYDYIELKYQNNGKLCCMDIDSFIIHFKTVDVYKDIAYDVKKSFHTSNYEVNRPLLRGRNKKIIGLFQDKLGGVGNYERFVALRPKVYSNLMDDGCEKRETTFKNH